LGGPYIKYYGTTKWKNDKIGLAKTKGLIPAAKPLLEQLAQQSYYLGPSVIVAVLAEAGE
jgi:predicted nucleic acid-binding protein